MMGVQARLSPWACKSRGRHEPHAERGQEAAPEKWATNQ